LKSLARALALLALGAALGCVAAPPPRADPPASDVARVLVFYPAGSCGGELELELELWDRVAGVWRPHPDHPRVPTDSCRRELPGQLLNELRVRCVDPTGRRAPSDWVIGAEVARTSAPCAEAAQRRRAPGSR
jgi:hypothetical protein